MKHLVVCLDGTWNDRDSEASITNVVKIMRCVENRDCNGNPQVTFYDAGVGTGDVVDRITGGAFGKGLVENIQDGYRFLCNNYEEGDKLYVFGFSRGAYTARSLCGLVCSQGLLRKNQLHRVDVVWNRFKGQPPARTDEIEPPIEVGIECLGVWDTVGALGIPETIVSRLGIGKAQKERLRFLDTNLSDKIAVALHGIAIDEKRAPFRPTLWQYKEGSDAPAKHTVEQVWFPGVHSDLGGGYKKHDLSDNALRWMIDRVAALTSLRLDQSHVALRDGDKSDGPMHDSMSPMYAVSGFIPYDRVISGTPFDRTTFQKWRFGEAGPDDDLMQPDDGHKFYPQALHRSAEARHGTRVTVIKDEAKNRSETVPYEPANLTAALKAKVPVTP